jgi:predicted O-methyltransferase YrrM
MNSERVNFLKKLKAYGLANDIPNISETTAQMLHFFVRMKQAKKVLEIGCANGYSTIWIADAVEQNDGTMLTCDVSEPSFNQAKENIKATKLDHIVQFKFGDAKKTLKDCEEKFDIIFIDARKKHYHIFWEMAKDMLADKGVIIIDDVLKFQHKTAEFNKTMEKETDWEKITLPVDGDDGIMFVQKK